VEQEAKIGLSMGCFVPGFLAGFLVCVGFWVSDPLFQTWPKLTVFTRLLESTKDFPFISQVRKVLENKLNFKKFWKVKFKVLQKAWKMKNLG